MLQTFNKEHCQLNDNIFENLFKKIFLLSTFAFYCCSSTVFCLVPPPLRTTPVICTSLPCFHHTCFCPCVRYTCSCKPFTLFTPFIPFHLPSGYCQFVLNFDVFGYILLVCFVDWVPVKGEIIWYLSLNSWLISLSIMLSSSIHIVAKCRSSFLLFPAYNSIL